MSSKTMIESVKRNIERFGTNCRLVIKLGSGTINFDTGKSEDVVQEYPLKGVISKYKDSQIIEGVINIDDLKLTIQVEAEAKKGDLVAIGNTQYAVMNVSSLVRNGITIKTVLQLRETYNQSLSTCEFSIGGTDGTEFSMTGIWSKSCIMFKA